jgi:hypothetical protein
VAAFATDAVRELWRQSASASANLSEHVAEYWPQWSAAKGYEQQELEAEMEKDEAFRRFRQASAQGGRKLAEQIRAELHTEHR